MAYRHSSSSVDFASPYAIRHRSAASSPILESEEEHFTNTSYPHCQAPSDVQTAASSRNLVSGQIVPPTSTSPSSLPPLSTSLRSAHVRRPKNRCINSENPITTYPCNPTHRLGGPSPSSDPGFRISASESNATGGRTPSSPHSHAFILAQDHHVHSVSRSDMSQLSRVVQVVDGRSSAMAHRTLGSSVWSKGKNVSEDLSCGEVSPRSPRGSSPVKHCPGASTNAVVRTVVQMQMQPEAEAIPSQEQEALPLDTPRATTRSIMTREPSMSKPSIMMFSESATDKLTRRFPIHPTVRNLPALHEYAADRTALSGRRPQAPTQDTLASALLDESGGLGVERVDRWSGYKWCLFFSVCSVLVYGLLGLACALLTWFKGPFTWLYNSRIAVDDMNSMGPRGRDVSSRLRHPHPHNHLLLHPPPHLPHRYHRHNPQLPPHPSHLHSPPLARPILHTRHRIYILQTLRLCPR